MESILAQSEESKAFVKELCFEFAHEAASLWLLRKKAVCAPHYNLTDLLELDNRLEAQIDALRVAGEPGWEVCSAKLANGKPEYFFAPSLLAFEIRDEARIGALLEEVEKTPSVSEGVISALGWMPWEQAEPHIQTLLKSKSAVSQIIGLSASVLHRQDPGPYLENAFYSPDPKLKARSLQAVGELGGRGDKMMQGRLQDQLKSEDASSRFWAGWSKLLLGDMAAIDYLKPHILDTRSSFRPEALQLLLRRTELKDALILHQQLTRAIDSQRLAVIGAGVIGDPALVPWLLPQMNIPALARAAGEAFTMITGVDLETEKLTGPWPEGFEAGPNDNPKDENVAMDPDENLPWPDANKITAWWDSNKSNFKTGVRYLLGKPITKEHLQSVLQTGLQRQRAAAALELALLEPGKPLYNTFAPALRQMPDHKPQQCPVIAPNYGSRQLAITAVNCITPLGHNAAQTAASVRAGITRFQIYEDYQDQSGKPITAARIKGIRDDVGNDIERIRDIAEICLSNLLNLYLSPPDDAYECLSPSGGGRGRLSAGGTSPAHAKVHRRIPPSEVHFFLGVASGNRPGPDYGEENMIVLKHTFKDRFGNFSQEIIDEGNASFQSAVSKAAQIISSKPDALCVIGCVDCLLRESILDWFESTGRLKSSSYGRHHGLIPSEAVCFLTVEDREHASQAGRPVLAKITALGLAEEPHPRASDASGVNKGLTEACNAAVDTLKGQTLQAVFGDLNGEDERAREWGTVRMRIFETDGIIPPLLSPADTYGDAGAASGAVMAGIVAHGLQKKWLSSPVMMFCSDDHGPCGAVILEKEENPVQGAR